MCLVFVSLNEQGVRSGILAQASARRPEVESGIHLVCLVFSGGSIPSDKGRGGGGGAVVQTLRWGGGAEAPPNISNTGAEGSATRHIPDAGEFLQITSELRKFCSKWRATLLILLYAIIETTF